MYIVRWLMGHPIIATWVLGLIAILLTLGPGQKGDTLEQANMQTGHSEVVANSVEKGLNDITTSTPSTKKTIKDNKLVITSSESEENAESIVNLANEAAKEAVRAVEATNEPENEVIQKIKEKPSTTEANVKEDTVVKQEVQLSSDTADINTSKAKPASSEVADLGQSSTEELLQMAREAYWNNGLDEAAQIYTKLIDLEPKNVEHKGELGNVYWKQGYPKKAAELYSEISILMIEEGNSERVANMIGFIGLFYPDRAADIHKRIQSEQAKNQ